MPQAPANIQNSQLPEKVTNMEIYDVIGNFGPWQSWVLYIFMYISMLGMWQSLSIVFFAPNVPFRCIEPATSMFLNNSNETYFDKSCHVRLFLNGSLESSVVPCTRWEYDTSHYTRSIVSEWDLVCDREWLVSLVKSVYMIGFLCSAIFFGQLSDWLGRRPVLVLSYLVTVVSMFLTLLSSSFTMFTVLRFFHAFGRTALTAVGYVLFMEMIGPEQRLSRGIMMQMGWAFGFCTLPAISWFIRDWFWFQLALSLPFLPIAVLYRKIPESPRWLLMHGKMEKLEALITKAIIVNKREIKGEVKDLDIFKTSKHDLEKKRSTLLDLLRLPRMRKRTFFMVYLWLVNAFMYYGLTYNINDLAGDPYLNFLMAGLLEFPTYAMLYFCIRRFGNRPTLFAIMMGAGCLSIAVAFAPQPGYAYAWIGTVLCLAGKFCVTSSFRLLYLYSAELYPTVVRNVALGVCSMFARVGSVIAPFVKELGKATHPSVPYVLYGVLAISSATLAFIFVPETSRKNLPDSLKEGEEFGLSKEPKSLNVSERTAE